VHAEAKDWRRRSHAVSMTDCSAGLGWAPAGSRLGRREWVGLQGRLGWKEKSRLDENWRGTNWLCKWAGGEVKGGRTDFKMMGRKNGWATKEEIKR
jgi:hypothetical protein